MAGQPLLFNASSTEVSWSSSHDEVLSRQIPRVRFEESSPTGAAGYALLANPDRSIAENLTVRCAIVRPDGARPERGLDRACILLHGLNERGWDKYWAWATAIAERARCAVVLFPLAFHMDRSPEGWGNFGIMRGLSKDRMARYPGLGKSSMANAAISERLDRDPSRFFRSGLMSAGDLRDLLQILRSGGLPGIAAEARLGFFGYSIGAYMVQCMTLADECFAAAGRRFLFSGGPYLSAMTPVSKFIMDSRAHQRIIDFWVADLSAELHRDEDLAALVDTAEGRGFCTMVDPRHPQGRRREVFSDGATKVVSLALDEVMPHRAILDFFKDTTVVPEFIELPSVCTHISPFDPLGGAGVSPAFNRLFDEAVEHLFG